MSNPFRALQLHSREAFQRWLAGEGEARAALDALIGAKLGADEDSLDALEAFLLKRYAGPEKLLAPAQRETLDAAARHVGRVLLSAADGAQWAIDLDDPDNAYYRLPIVRFDDDAEECPLSMVTAALDRRSGRYLRGVVEAYR